MHNNEISIISYTNIKKNRNEISTGAGGKDTFISIIYPLPSIYKLMPIYRDFLLEQSLIIINNR
jgi:hypothetical protein